jgi:hypothetical protein
MLIACRDLAELARIAELAELAAYVKRPSSCAGRRCSPTRDPAYFVRFIDNADEKPRGA